MTAVVGYYNNLYLDLRFEVLLLLSGVLENVYKFQSVYRFHGYLKVLSAVSANSSNLNYSYFKKVIVDKKRLF